MENRFNVIYRRWWFLTAASVVAVSLWTFAQVLALPMRDMAYQLAVFNTAWQQRVQGYCRQLAPDCQSVAFERHLLTTQLQDEPRRWLGGQTVVRFAADLTVQSYARRLVQAAPADALAILRKAINYSLSGQFARPVGMR